MQILRQHKPDLQKKYPVSKLGVFGSYARGEATENSDIDIAVEINGPMGLALWQWQMKLKPYLVLR